MQLARALLADGADLIDIGGESGVTNRPPVDAREEIERVAPVIEAVAGGLGARVSVDTYKPAVARAAVAAGASIVNDVSGLRDPELAEVCARPAPGSSSCTPSRRRRPATTTPGSTDRIAGEVQRFLAERIELAMARGVAFEQIMVDPGPDFSKPPRRRWPSCARCRCCTNWDARSCWQ